MAKRFTFGALIGKPRAEEAEEQEEDAAAEEGEEQEEEEASEEAGEGEDEPEEEDEKSASSGKGKSRLDAAFALIGAPEAKGREKLANELARDVAAGKIGPERAKAILASAPKASRLGEAMAGRDVNPGASDGDAPPVASRKAKAGWERAVLKVNKRIGGRTA